MRRSFFLGIFIMFILAGCSSIGKTWKSIVGGTPKESLSATGQVGPKTRGLRFSQSEDVPFDEEGKQYRRMTRDIFENQARVEERAGSLWVMEGQGSYLFSQNTTRLLGDALNVRLEGEPKKVLEAKADIIKKLMKKSKSEEKRAIAAAAEAKVAEGEKKDGETDKSKDVKQTGKSEDKDDDEKDVDSTFQVNTIPAQIMERTFDGNYRIRGSQSFMIGKHEYRVIAVGVVKPSDINDETVDSSRMLESKFDIVSLRKEIKQ